MVFTAPTQTIALYHISSIRFNWRWKSNCVYKQGGLKSILKCSSLSKLFAISWVVVVVKNVRRAFSFCLVWFQFLTNRRKTLCTFVWLKVWKSGQPNVQLVLQHCCKNELKSDVGRFITLESNLSWNNRLLQVAKNCCRKWRDFLLPATKSVHVARFIGQGKLVQQVT